MECEDIPLDGTTAGANRDWNGTRLFSSVMKYKCPFGNVFKNFPQLIH